LRAAADLALILGGVEVPEGAGDEPVGPEGPLFVTADMHRLSGAAGSAVGTGEGPAVDRVRALDTDVVHADAQVREGGHETLRGVGDGFAPAGRCAAVD